ncbi:MAG: DMT family transporter [Actinomycetota bacterium]
MPTTRRQHLIAVVLALAVTVLWSSSWILIRWGLDDEALPPLTFAGLRYGLAAIVLLIAVGTSQRHRAEVRSLDRRTTRSLAVLGLIFYALTQGAQFVAIDNQPAATTSLLLSLTPLVVAFVGYRTLGERASGRQVGGAVLVVAGALTYFAGGLGATAIGVLAALVALGANVSSTLFGRGVNRTQALSPLVVTAVSMTIGAIVLCVLGIALDGVPDVTGRAAVLIVWLAVINTALAFTLWNASLRHLAAVESAGINNTMLVQIALLAWVFLDEAPGIAGIVGIIAVSVGVFFTQGTTAPRQIRSEDSERTR